MTHTPGPWTACHDGKCKCKLVSGEEHPIAQVISGEWGDDYPNIRLVPNQHGIGKVAEAYMDRIVYGEIDETVAQANARLIAVAPNLLAACKAVLAKSLLKDSFGEMVCLFCGRYPGPEGHDEDCPYPLIAAAIAKTEGKTEENANATHT